MITRVCFISFSPCGETERILESLGHDITLPKDAYNITLPQNRKEPLHFSSNDMVFLGFPVYGGRLPLRFPALMDSLHGDKTPAVMVASYGNRAFEGAFLDMRDTMLAKGFIPFAAVAAIAEHSSSPRIATERPDSADKAKLAEFGSTVLEKAHTSVNPIAAPGAYPTWTLPPGSTYFPEVDMNACNACGRCVRVCPVGAIPEHAPQTTLTEKCIICSACVKYCPQKARALGDAKTRKALASHLDDAITRKEPALFI